MRHRLQSATGWTESGEVCTGICSRFVISEIDARKFTIEVVRFGDGRVNQYHPRRRAQCPPVRQIALMAFANPSMRLHVDLHDGSGPAVMLLHGFLSSRVQWLANIPGLSQFCRPVTVELWGHGRSPTPDDTALLSPEAYVEQFEQIRRALGIDRWYVVGQSFGAGLTLLYSMLCPEVVIGQAFCNSNSALERTDGRDVSARGSQIREVLHSGKPLTDLPVHPVNARRIPDHIKAAMVADSQALVPESLANSVRYTRSRLSVRDRFHTIEQPTLLINGVWEKHFQKAAAFAREALPALEVVELAGGHAINIEQPDAFNDAIRDHLQRCVD